MCVWGGGDLRVLIPEHRPSSFRDEASFTIYTETLTTSQTEYI